MAAPVCELCGDTRFVKEDGMFVCQGCGTKYSVEEARKLMRANAVAQADAQPQGSAGADVLPAFDMQFDSPAAFRPQELVAAEQGARGVNNYVCRGFQMLVDEYGKLDHPGKERFDELMERARECAALLDAAAQLDPSDHVANMLILANCEEMEDAVQAAHYYEKDDEGNWKSESGFFEKLEVPGQKDSWADKVKYHRNFLEQEFVDARTDVWQRKLELKAREDALNADLSDLKSEKRGKGLFNFAEKHEVKDRMKPVKDELADVRRQIAEIDRMVDAFVEEKLQALGQTYTRLRF